MFKEFFFNNSIYGQTIWITMLLDHNALCDNVLKISGLKGGTVAVLSQAVCMLALSMYLGR